MEECEGAPEFVPLLPPRVDGHHRAVISIVCWVQFLRRVTSPSSLPRRFLWWCLAYIFHIRRVCIEVAVHLMFLRRNYTPLKRITKRAQTCALQSRMLLLPPHSRWLEPYIIKRVHVLFNIPKVIIIGLAQFFFSPVKIFQFFYKWNFWLDAFELNWRL